MVIEPADIEWPGTLLLFRNYNGGPVQCVCGVPVRWVVHITVPDLPLNGCMLHNAVLPCGHLISRPSHVRLSPAAVTYAMLAGEPNEP